MAPHFRNCNGPALFRCCLGGEMKPIEAFSKNQRRKVGYGHKYIDPNHSKMVCMEHAPEPPTVEKCDHCNKTLSLDMFSKRTRQLNEFVCHGCREWIESEPEPARLAAKARAAAIEDQKYRETGAAVEKTAVEEASLEKAAIEKANFEKTAAEKALIEKTAPQKAAPKKNSAFPKDKTEDFDETESVIDSMYGFLDHLLEDVDEEEDAASVGSKTVTTTTETSRKISKENNTPTPLVALSASGSVITKAVAKKPHAADAEMSTVASNSWYGGRKEGSAPHLLSKEDLARKKQQTSITAASKNSLPPHLRSTDEMQQTSVTAASQNSLPPHLRSTDGMASTRPMAPYERSSSIAVPPEEDSDAGSEKTILANNADAARTVIQEEPRVPVNPDNYVVQDIRRAMRILHREQEEWMKAQPIFEMDDDSEEDQN